MRELDEACQEQLNSPFIFTIAKIMHVCGDQLQTINIIIAWVIIRYKSDDDILMGVSKLDDILKISCF
jgi:hypothetical protein